MRTNTLLLLIASYLRKSNHPQETDAEIAQGVIKDLVKIENNLIDADFSIFDKKEIIKKRNGK
ncbi:MAG: hypothetical protein QM500_04155 [Methylococcales bacterium]